eukprot:jgi/Botrbrau1/14662/Bobra.0108s0023.1
MEIRSRVYARIGLLGNPSDGYFGKTISVSLSNYFAEAILVDSPSVKIEGHASHDNLEHPSLSSMSGALERQGFGGGIRLLQATCKAFHNYCSGNGIDLPDRNFSLKYDTNIPRQSGLSGSSAIACATLNCLLAFYGIVDRVSLDERASLLLGAEELLGITAGLQDRVIQVYGGLMYMDFDEQFTKQHPGSSRYERLDPGLLPRLWLVYTDNPSDSGTVHSRVRERWKAGDPHVRQTMSEIAQCAHAGRRALEEGKPAELAALMNRNFDLRRSIFGDEVLGAQNLHMISVARSVGGAAKFCGSGGAIVVFCPGGNSMEAELQAACQREGLVCELVHVAPPNDGPSPLGLGLANTLEQPKQ